MFMMGLSMKIKDIKQHIIGKLGRVTSSGKFIANIDGLRFFAVILVVVFHIEQKIGKVGIHADSHAGEIMSSLCRCGWFGVELFFAISGFVLALPFARHYLSEQPSVPKISQYYLRRLTRIEPPYVISLIVFFALRVFFNQEEGGVLLPHFLASLFYVHNAWFQSHSLINAVSWSLEVEVQFYLLAPLLSQVFRLKRPLQRWVALLSLPILINLPFHGINVLSIYQMKVGSGENLFHFLHYFMVGFVVADLYVTHWHEKPIRQWQWDIAGISSVIGIFAILIMRWSVGYIAITPLLIVCVCSAFKGKLCAAIVCMPWLATIGGMCYTIYLYHNISSDLAMQLLMRVWPAQSYMTYLLLGILIVIPVLLAFSSLAFILFEKPFMYRDWPKKAVAFVRRSFCLRGCPRGTN